MTVRIFLNVFVLLLFSTGILFPQQPQKTKVLILGTSHLSFIEDIKPNHLQSVISELSKFEFNVIGIESMSAELLLDIRGRELPHWRELSYYFSDRLEAGDRFQKMYKVGFADAQTKIDSILKKDNLSDEERIKLIKFFLCSYDPWSALLNYLQLKDTSLVEDEIASYILKYKNSNNEINLLAIPLAISTQLNSLNYIDNLQDETKLLHKYPGFIEEYIEVTEMLNDTTSTDIYSKVKELEEQSVMSGDFLELYRFLNSPEFMSEDFEKQWALWFRTNFKSRSDLARYYYWEMRNLQIAANVVELIAQNPGGNILVIIGASHKFFIEKFLERIPGVELMKI